MRQQGGPEGLTISQEKSETTDNTTMSSPGFFQVC